MPVMTSTSARRTRHVLVAGIAAAAALALALPAAAADGRDAAADDRADRTVSRADRSRTSSAEPVLDRLGGSTRYSTAVAVTSAVWDDGAALGYHVYIASGENFPDALAGGPAASHVGMPLLLVPRTGTLPTVVADELRRLQPSFITIFGGTGAVSASMATQLKAFAGTKEVYREAGANRYDTARILANYATQWPGSTPVYPDVVYVSSGTSFADALAGGGAAALDGAPLLLTPRDHLADETAAALAEIGPSKIVVLGGTGAVSPDVATALKGYAPTVVRIGGTDRFDTAARVSKATFPDRADVVEVFLANGLGYADALAATPAVGVLGDVSMLLTRPTCVPDMAFAEVSRLEPGFVTAIGGTAAVSDAALGGRAC